MFVYGELCKPAVLSAVLGRVPAASLAVLEGFQRRLDAGTGYYRAQPHPGVRLVGLILRGVSPQEFDMLDAFENVDGGEYRRIQVEVGCLGGRRTTAWVYAGGAGS